MTGEKASIRFLFGSTGGITGYDASTIMVPWELSHVTSYSEAVTSTNTVVGVPTRPATRAQVFDMTGAVRTFKISGQRNEYEEDISNFDFLYKQFNQISPFKVSVGISWLLSNIQCSNKGYKLIVENDTDDMRFYANGTAFNVGITDISASFDNNNPYLLNYTLTLVERKVMGSNNYKAYNSV